MLHTHVHAHVLTRKTNRRSLGTFQKQCCVRNRRTLDRKALSLFYCFVGLALSKFLSLFYKERWTYGTFMSVCHDPGKFHTNLRHFLKIGANVMPSRAIDCVQFCFTPSVIGTWRLYELPMHERH